MTLELIQHILYTGHHIMVSITRNIVGKQALFNGSRYVECWVYICRNGDIAAAIPR
jgi:hypothetical protein